MRSWALAGAIAVLLCLALIAGAPARLLPGLLPEGQAVLQGMSGSLWRGTASRCLIATPAGYLHLGRVRWRLRPLSLLLLSPALEFDSEWGSQYARGVITVRGAQDFSLRNTEVSADARLLRQLAPLAVEGRLTLLASRLQLKEGAPAGASGRLTWERGSWQAPRGRLPLGTFALEFEQADASVPLSGEVVTVAGPLQASGSVTLDGRDYTLDLLVSSEQDLDPALERALSLVARPADSGYHLQLEGVL